MKKLTIGFFCSMLLIVSNLNNENIQLKEEQKQYAPNIAALETEINSLEEEIKTLEAETKELSNQSLTRKEMFYLAAKVYKIDGDMLYAIAKHETGNFKSSLFINNNNPGGIKAGKGWAKYDSEFEGIMEMARLIRKNYYDYGLDTLEKIESKYCPDDSNWAEAIRLFMVQC